MVSSGGGRPITLELNKEQGAAIQYQAQYITHINVHLNDYIHTSIVFIHEYINIMMYTDTCTNHAAKTQKCCKQMQTILEWKHLLHSSILHPNLLRHPTAAKSWNLNSCSPSCPEFDVLNTHAGILDCLIVCCFSIYFFLAPWRGKVDERLGLRFAEHMQMHNLNMCANETI